MSALIKRFGDYHVSLVREYVDDEYQEKIENQSNTIVVNTLPYTLYGIGAVLAWAIPGSRSLLSLLVFLPLAVGIVFGNGWMKHYAPRPKPVVPKWMLAIVIPLVILQGLGIVYNVIALGNEDWNLFVIVCVGTVGGGIIGGLAGATGTVSKMQKNRASDIKRLEADLED